MSLEEIKAVHAGDHTLADALAHHLERLELDQADLQRSRDVCRVMQGDGVSYDTLDAPRYLAQLEQAVSSGSGNEVDLEQILEWNPEYILFAPDSCYAEVASLPEWQSLDAIAAGHYYEAPYGPYGPYGWLSSPPAVQRYLGILWLGSLLYPEYTDYDLQEEVTAYYKLFYGCDLTEDMYQALVQNAL